MDKQVADGWSKSIGYTMSERPQNILDQSRVIACDDAETV